MKMLLLVALAAIGQPQQFDLLCTFTDAPKIKGMPAGQHFRIDLASGKWCVDACAETMSFAEVSSTKLILKRVDPAYRGGDEHLLQVDRMTGQYFSFDRWDVGPSVGSTRPSVIEGKCESTGFSGFPEVAAKF